jgi:hypothetical protein
MQRSNKMNFKISPLLVLSPTNRKQGHVGRIVVGENTNNGVETDFYTPGNKLLQTNVYLVPLTLLLTHQ